MIRLVLAFSILLLGSKPGTACQQDEPCTVELGSYHLATPPEGDTPRKAVIYFHGHRGSGAKVVANRGLVRKLHSLGYLLVAPNGSPRGANGDVLGWPGYEDANGPRDEIAFIEQVMADVDLRFEIDWKQSIVTGFSAGGSMAWYTACHLGARFGGFAPVAGALRHPRSSEGCQGGPVHLIHIHGFADKQVPIEGRAIRDWHQGDVFDSMTQARLWNRCRTQPDNVTIENGFRCRQWSQCESGHGLRLCLHDGGHGLPKGWTELGFDWLTNN